MGLYSYLRQIELSLDRIAPSNIQELSAYLNSSGRYEPLLVANYFNEIAMKGDNLIFKRHASNFFMRVIGTNKLLIRNYDMITIVNSLYRVSNMLHSNPSVYELASMRNYIGSMSWAIIGSKIGYQNRVKAHSVEHFNQSEYLLFNRIDDILSTKWIQ